jgi:hypothetical protein
MQKLLFCFIFSAVILSAGCVGIDESGFDGAGQEAIASGDAQSFGPASLAGIWTGESNWDGVDKEIVVMVRKPIVERMVTPTGQAPAKKAEPAGNDESRVSVPAMTLKPDSKSKAPKTAKPGEPAVPTGQAGRQATRENTAPEAVWEPITDTGLVFWGWDIFIKGEENKPFFNIQIVFKEEGPGEMSVFSQTGGKGRARFIREGREQRIEVSMSHPMFKDKEIKGRFLYMGGRINGSFVFLDKEGIFKINRDDSIPEGNQQKAK